MGQAAKGVFQAAPKVAPKMRTGAVALQGAKRYGAVGGVAGGAIGGLRKPGEGESRLGNMARGAVKGGVIGAGAGAALGGGSSALINRNNPAMNAARQRLQNSGNIPSKFFKGATPLGLLAKQVGKKGIHYSQKEPKKKEAGIGSALRTGGSKVMSGLRRLGAPPAPKISGTKALIGGVTVGGAGGAAHGLVNAQPGEDKTQAMMRGMRTGALVGAGGAFAGRHIGNKVLKARHARQMAKLGERELLIVNKGKGVWTPWSKASKTDQDAYSTRVRARNAAANN